MEGGGVSGVIAGEFDRVCRMACGMRCRWVQPPMKTLTSQT